MMGRRGGHSAMMLAGIGGVGTTETEGVECAQAVRLNATTHAIRLDLTGHLIHSGLKLRDVADTLDFVAFADGRVFSCDLGGLFDAALKMLCQISLVISLTSSAATPITHTKAKANSKGTASKAINPFAKG